jgi:hypothetical protein
LTDKLFDAVLSQVGLIYFPVQWLADNGSAYTVTETTDFAAALNLVPCFTPERSTAASIQLQITKLYQTVGLVSRHLSWGSFDAKTSKFRNSI